MLNSVVGVNISKKDYFLITLLIAISGVNYFLGNTYLAISCLTVYLFFRKNKRLIPSLLIKYLVFVGVVFVGSAIWYLSTNLTNYLSMFVRIITAFMIMDLLREKFIYVYVKVMYVLCLIGLICWSTFVLFPNLELFFLTNITPFFDFYLYETNEGISAHMQGVRPAPHFIIYTMNHGNSGFLPTQLDHLSNLEGLNRIFMRNSSCFTEPSSAMLYIIPALLFNLVITGKGLCKRNVVFVLSILTSWSTGGLSVLFFSLIGWSVIQKLSLSKLLILPLMVGISYVAFTNIESFGAEILDKISVFESGDVSKASRTRFVSGFLDFKEAFSHPFFGKGFYNHNNGVFNYFDNHRNNGTLFLLNKYGFIAFFLYFFMIFKFFKAICVEHSIPPRFGYIMLLSLILIGFGNKNFEKPFFIGLTMIYGIAYSGIRQKGSSKTLDSMDAFSSVQLQKQKNS